MNLETSQSYGLEPWRGFGPPPRFMVVFNRNQPSVEK